MKKLWFGMRISDAILEKLNDLCLENGRSKTAQVEELIKDAWNKMHKNDKK